VILTPDDSINDERFIKNPFNTKFDVTGDTPIDQLPPDYLAGFKQEMYDKHQQQLTIEQQIDAFSKNPDIEEMMLEQAHKNISKYDDHITRMAFHVGLSAYLKPLNFALKAPSGSGKTYGTIQTMKFFPREDVEEIGSQSPKVISHQDGVLKTKDGREIKEENRPIKPNRKDYCDASEYNTDFKFYQAQKKQWDEDQKGAYHEIDLRNKTILFLESVNLETFKMFKTTMSHDDDYVDHKYVDDKGKVHITRTIGAPALIFNSVDNDYVEEFATRTFAGTPSSRKEKIEDSMTISNNKSCYPWLYDKEEQNVTVIKEYIKKGVLSP